jgi:hypothetical protein
VINCHLREIEKYIIVITIMLLSHGIYIWMKIRDRAGLYFGLDLVGQPKRGSGCIYPASVD